MVCARSDALLFEAFGPLNCLTAATGVHDLLSIVWPQPLKECVFPLGRDVNAYLNIGSREGLPKNRCFRKVEQGLHIRQHLGRRGGGHSETGDMAEFGPKATKRSIARTKIMSPLADTMRLIYCEEP